MKVLTAICVALALVAAHGATKCHDKCGGGSASCQTKSEAAYCVKGFLLNSNNRCVQCGNIKSANAGTGLVGKAVGDGKWWEAWNDGSCTTCVANCETCASKTTCAVGGCKQYFALASATSCVACSANCATCTSATVCTFCKTGFGKKANACVACPSNCNKCDTDNTKCDAGNCAAGFSRATNGNCVACKATATTGVNWNPAAAGKCQSCTTNCATCTADGKCSAGNCSNGNKVTKTLGNYFVTASKSCAACTAGCSKCTTADSNKCDVGGCFNGYSRQAAGTCIACAVGAGYNFLADKCTQCDANCKTCQDNTKCGAGQCNSGYVLDGVSKCQTCDVTGCATCILATRTGAGKKCSTCKPGYYKDDAISPVPASFTTCTQCDANCNSCKNTYQCNNNSCNTGYLLADNGKCVKCENKGSCAANNNYVPSTNNAGTCNAYPLAAGRVKTNDAKVTTIFNAHVDAQCVTCIAGCGTCAANAKGAGECQQCSNTKGYWPIKKNGTPENAQNGVNMPAKDGGTCKQCQANCAQCATSTTCQKCQDGNAGLKTGGFYKTGTNTCSACVANCAVCTAANACSGACFTGFMKSATNTCVACTADQQNKQGYFFDVTGAGKCAVCTPNCKKCSLKDTCAANSCFDGFRNNAKVCEACTVPGGNCNRCQTNKAKCDAGGCKTGFQLAANGNCVACAGVNQFFTAAGNGACATCDANCVSCASATQCAANSCKSGYYVDNNGKCGKCGVANCATCAQGTAATICTACAGKYFKNVAGTSCSIQCDAHATSCTDQWAAAGCDEAKRYYLSTAKRCVYCDVPAKVGGGADNAKKGNQYFWDGTYCTHCDPNADGCTASTSSTQCKTGYTHVTGVCVKNCAAGTKQVGGKGKCFSCGSHVVAGRCASEYQAAECTKGYHVQGAGVGTCCGDDSGAASVGVSILAAAVASVLALFQ